ncbi:hypothetical protein [Serratia sp. CY85251]|uniref:hypothetical protein n=1 Tax=Serratia sp. CY85251 TaxID=3383696 RepID=UPI003FA11FCC
MSRKLIVSLFKDENSAYEASIAIKKIKDDDFDVKAGILLKKDSLGNIHTLKEKDRALWGTLGGTLFGILIGLLAGPIGAAAGGIFGMFLGLFGDTDTIDMDSSFVSSIAAGFVPGTIAMILDADEGSSNALDAIIKQHKGVSFRQDVY